MAMAAGRRRSLSDLPDNTVEEILCRLPIKDAARTSVLSRSWRCRWRSIPHIDLSGLYSSKLIYKILPLLSGPIRLFKVQKVHSGSIRLFNYTPKRQRFDVQRCLTALSLHSSSSLHTLVLLLNSLSCDLDLIQRCFPHLTHLELSGRLSVPPQFRGLTSLRELHLHDFMPPEDTEHGVSNLISACPLLETLYMSNHIIHDFNEFYIDINAPNLRRFYLEGYFTVMSAPLLEVARMLHFYYDDRRDYNNGDGTVGDCLLAKVFRGIVTIRKLEVDHSVLKFLGIGHVPRRSPVCFNNLKTVSLRDLDFGCKKTMLVLLCLLRSCPSLLELIMDTCHNLGTDHNVWDLEAQEDVYLFNNLEVVTMTQRMWTRHELCFIKFVLAKAKVLKAVHISFHKNLKNTDSIVADLLKFPRVSNQAQILLTRHARKARAH